MDGSEFKDNIGIWFLVTKNIQIVLRLFAYGNNSKLISTYIIGIFQNDMDPKEIIKILTDLITQQYIWTQWHHNYSIVLFTSKYKWNF